MRQQGLSFGPHVDGDGGEWAQLGMLVRENPDQAWSSLLEVAATTDEAGLFWVGDIIEDLITFHGDYLASRLEAELAINRPLRRAFVSVVPQHRDSRLEDRFITLRERIEASADQGRAAQG